VSGKVYDPALRNPLYDVAVYIPGTKPSAFSQGASCYQCSDLYTGNPISSALTAADGTFQLTNVPDGTNIPIVVQVGKWRMQTTLPNVSKCLDNPVPDKTLHLPTTHDEGDIPNIAVSTGGADSLECLFQRIGVDPTEYVGGPGGSGRIHVYYGDGGANTTPPAPNAWSSPGLWDSDADLMAFDMILLSCEGHETTNMQQQNLLDYANAGGRVFASHYHYAWFNTGPFAQYNLAHWTTGSQSTNTISALIETTYLGGAFPKGVAMHDWLKNVGALTNDMLTIEESRHNADVRTANEPPSVPWIVADQTNATQYFSFDTPVTSAASSDAGGGACGRVVYSDLHVGGASGDYGQKPGGSGQIPSGQVTPAGCANNPLSPQEKALEFMIFDLSSCLTSVSSQPVPPPTGTGPR